MFSILVIKTWIRIGSGSVFSLKCRIKWIQIRTLYATANGTILSIEEMSIPCLWAPYRRGHRGGRWGRCRCGRARSRTAGPRHELLAPSPPESNRNGYKTECSGALFETVVKFFLRISSNGLSSTMSLNFDIFFQAISSQGQKPLTWCKNGAYDDANINIFFSIAKQNYIGVPVLKYLQIICSNFLWKCVRGVRLSWITT